MDIKINERQENISLLEELLKNEDQYNVFCENFGSLVIREIILDDEYPHKLARQIIDAYLENDADNMLMAICDWTMKSLIKFAEEQQNAIGRYIQ